MYNNVAFGGNATNSSEMVMQEKGKVIRKLVNNFYMHQFTQDWSCLEWVFDDNEEWKAFDKYMGRKKRCWPFVMVTINPMSKLKIDYDAMDLMADISKICTKVWVKKWAFCIECRNGLQNLGGIEYWDGVHAHVKLWIRENKKPSEIMREIRKKFEDVVGNHKHIDFKFSDVEGCFDKYIAGLKKDRRKKNHDNDKLMRKHFGFEQFYVGENSKFRKVKKHVKKE